MTDLQPLAVLLERNERQRDVAMAEHQRTVTAGQAAAAQAEQLRVYRGEYEQRWQAHFARDGAIELLRCYQGFMERLTQAVEHQARVEVHAALQIERAQLALREADMRCASVRLLIERRTRERRLADERRDQKLTDEFAARAAWNRHAAAAQRRPA